MTRIPARLIVATLALSACATAPMDESQRAATASDIEASLLAAVEDGSLIEASMRHSLAALHGPKGPPVDAVWFLDITLEWSLGQSHVAIDGRLHCEELASSTVLCHVGPEGVFVDLDTDRFVTVLLDEGQSWEIELMADAGDPAALLAQHRQCHDIALGDGQMVQVCATD